MTVAPWGFGINRQALEDGVCDLVRLLLRQAVDPTLPDDRVYIADQGSGAPMRPRPCVAILIGPSVTPVRVGPNVRYWPIEEMWLLTFTDSADGDYTVDVLGQLYTVSAVGLTVTELRDAMLAEMALGLHPDWLAVSSGANVIGVAGTVKGKRLFVSVAPATITRARPQANYYERALINVLMQVNLECWGRMDLQNPVATESGPSISEIMQAGFSNRRLLLPLRDCGFSPTIVRPLTDGGPTFNQQTSTSATCQIVFRAVNRLDVQVGSGTDVTITPTVEGT